MAEHIYTLDGDTFHPTHWAGSPWSATSQHGGPPNALFMRAAELAADEASMRVARMTVDILKPIPLQPLILSTSYARQGRRMAILDSKLSRADNGTPVALSRAVILKEHGEHEALFPAFDRTRPGPEALNSHDLVSQERRETGPQGFHLAIDVRYGGAGDDPIIWFTAPLGLVDGEPMSPGQLCAAICDLTTVVSGRIRNAPPGMWDNTRMFKMLNTDTTLHLFRPPEGQWFGFGENFIADHHGIGVAEVTVYDEHGSLGRAVQTVASNA
ncbi:MAG: thioesterase family protein [Rhodospirillaceae bacterium]|jgi:hypothetical protein|nr:thioesterase family protein [Rhodospirillaceae bacterium]